MSVLGVCEQPIIPLLSVTNVTVFAFWVAVGVFTAIKSQGLGSGERSLAQPECVALDSYLRTPKRPKKRSRVVDDDDDDE